MVIRMRIWNINPKLLCRVHLLGEHLECHMFVGCLKKQKNIDGYIKKGYVEIHNIHKRHEEIVVEMKRRGFNHNSEIPDFSYFIAGKIDINKSLRDLKGRCSSCMIGEKIRI